MSGWLNGRMQPFLLAFAVSYHAVVVLPEPKAVIRLQWMFPTRMRINVLRKAEDLSERADPSSLEQAIQLLRCAQGLETN
jgi:hypothetical protein